MTTKDDILTQDEWLKKIAESHEGYMEKMDEALELLDEHGNWKRIGETYPINLSVIVEILDMIYKTAGRDLLVKTIVKFPINAVVEYIKTLDDDDLDTIVFWILFHNMRDEMSKLSGEQYATYLLDHAFGKQKMVDVMARLSAPLRRKEW